MHQTSSNPSPVLSAVMCDGMGWFSANDYKRMLLLYDKIFYLIPSRTTEFEDIDGRPQFLVFPKNMRQLGFEYRHYEPDELMRGLIMQAAEADAGRASFASTVASIPASERLYTWRITNTDADLGHGSSVSIRPGEDALAHALLLNKFLLGAESVGAIPITGKKYIHGLISEKYAASTKMSEMSERKDTLNAVAMMVIDAIVADRELERRTEDEILDYRNRNRALFETFSYSIRKLVKQVVAVPGSMNFEQQVAELINTEIWHEKSEVERELRGAWSAFFRTSIKSGVAGAVALGITPFLSLGHLSIAGILAGAAATAPWAVSQAIDALQARSKARDHGIYYLLNFGQR